VRIRAYLTALAALAVPVLLLTSPAVPAHAATWYEIENIYSDTCLTQDGTTAAVYLQACGTGSNINHSQLWYLGIANQLVNVHSGDCILVTGYDTGPWMSGGTICTSADPNPVAVWNYGSAGDPPGGSTTILNGHTGWYLDNDVDVSNGDLIQEPYDIPGINWYLTPAN
jgi:hypothetical protein